MGCTEAFMYDTHYTVLLLLGHALVVVVVVVLPLAYSLDFTLGLLRS